MLKRILTAVAMLAVVFATILGLRQIYVELADIVGVVICCLGVYEMAQAFKKAGYNAIKGSLIFACIAIYPMILAFEWTIGKGEVGAFATIFLAVILAIIEFTLIHKTKKQRQQDKALSQSESVDAQQEQCKVDIANRGVFGLKDLLATIFILIYPLGIFSTFFFINHSQYGLLGIFLALLVPVMTDTMAYFVGVTFKGKKLCPNISPKKTIACFGIYICNIRTYRRCFERTWRPWRELDKTQGGNKRLRQDFSRSWRNDGQIGQRDIYFAARISFDKYYYGGKRINFFIFE